MKRFLLPLIIFIVMVGFFAAGLRLNPREVPSPLIGKPAPAFNLPLLAAPEKKLAAQDLRGKVWVLNVWASWCVPCLIEHPQITALARTGGVPVYGLNYKDKVENASAWLGKHGDPYTATVSDLDGLVGIDYGVYGVPETFVIDKQGDIRLKHIGPVTPEALRDTIMPMIKKLNG